MPCPTVNISDFPIYTVSDLSAFSGRSLDEYTPYADSAIIQALIFLLMVTQLNTFPSDQLEQMIFKYAVLAWADRLVLEQPYQDAVANPFQSQNAGSVSWSKPITYSRGNAQANALKGEQTGVQWFDLAVQKLAKRTEFGGVYSKSIEVAWDDTVHIRHDHETGEVRLVGPAEMDKDSLFGFNVSADAWGSGNGDAFGPGGMRG